MEGKEGENFAKFVEELLSQRFFSTWKLLKCLEDFVEDQKITTSNISQDLHRNLSIEGPGGELLI